MEIVRVKQSRKPNSIDTFGVSIGLSMHLPCPGFVLFFLRSISEEETKKGSVHCLNKNVKDRRSCEKSSLSSLTSLTSLKPPLSHFKALPMEPRWFLRNVSVFPILPKSFQTRLGHLKASLMERATLQAVYTV